jgi:hypothetical protein
MRPVVPSELNSIKGCVGEQIAQTYYSKRHRQVATEANVIMHDILSQPPIGWNVGTTRAEYNVACSDMVENEYLNQNPPGFLGTLIFGMVIRGIISWVVRRWLDNLFPKE